jgi:hypothetical protein
MAAVFFRICEKNLYIDKLIFQKHEAIITIIVFQCERGKSFRVNTPGTLIYMIERES